MIFSVTVSDISLSRCYFKDGSKWVATFYNVQAGPFLQGLAHECIVNHPIGGKGQYLFPGAARFLRTQAAIGVDQIVCNG